MPTINRNVLKPIDIKKPEPKRAFKVADYDTRSWRDYSYELRAKTLKCVVDNRPFRPKDLIVDHIIPVNEGGSFWDERNHQVICKWHHNSKTGIESKIGCQTPWELNENGEKIPKQ